MASQEVQENFPDELPEIESIDAQPPLSRVNGTTQREVLAALERRSDSISLDLLYARYGLLPHDHPLVRLAGQLLARICDDPEIHVEVLAGDDEINAFATKEKTVVLTRQTMEFCQSEEELLGVLHHEYNHIKKDHFKKKELKSAGIIDRFEEKLGRHRKQELLEADLESLVELDEKGINIAGYFSFFERLGEELDRKGRSRRLERDMEHGSIQERILFLKGALHLRDFKHYRPGESTPLSPEFQNRELYKDDFGYPFHAELERQEERFELRQNSLAELSPRQLFVLLGDLYEKIVGIRQLASDRKPLTAAQEYVERYEPFYKKMRKLAVRALAEKTGCSEEEVLAVIFLRQRMVKDIEAFLKAPPRELLAQAKKIPESIWNSLFVYEPQKRLQFAYARQKDGLSGDEYQFLLKVFNALYKGIPFPAGDQPVPAENQGSSEVLSEQETIHLSDFLLQTGIDVVQLEARDIKGKFNSKSEKEASREKLMRQDMTEKMRQAMRTNNIRITNLALWERISDWFVKGGPAAALTPLAGLIQNDPNMSLVEKHAFAIGLQTFLLCPELKLPPAKNKQEILDFYVSLSELSRSLEVTIPEGSEYKDLFGPLNKDASQHAVQIFADYPAGRLVGVFKELETALSLSDKYSKNLLERVFALRKKPFGLAGYEIIKNAFANLDYAGMWNNVLHCFCKEFGRDFSPAHEEHVEQILAMYEFIQSKRSGKDTPGDQQSAHLLFYKMVAQKERLLKMPEDALLLMRIAALCSDPVKKSLVINRAWDALLEQWETTGMPALATFFAGLPATVEIPFSVMERILEDFAETEEDIEACKKYMSGRAKDETALGEAVFSGEIFEFLVKDKIGLLLALLNPSTDKDLKERILKNTYYLHEERRGVYGESAAMMYALELNPLAVHTKLCGMGDVHKRIFIHLLLVGEHGVLQNREHVEKLIDFLFEHFVEEPADETERTFIAEAKKVLKTAVQVAEEDDLYHLLSELLAPRILKCPPRMIGETRNLTGRYKRLLNMIGTSTKKLLKLDYKS